MVLIIEVELENVSIFQSISSRARKKVFDVHNVFKETLELQKEYEIADTECNSIIKPRRVNIGFIQQPSILHSGISITLFDEPLVCPYHTVAPYCTLQADATGSITVSIPWLKYADNKPRKILIYALTVKSPTEKAPSIAIAEHITSNHKVFSIRNLFSKLREIDYQIYQQNVFPKLVITDTSKTIIHAVLNELNRETFEVYLKRIYGIIFEDPKTKKNTKISNSSVFVSHSVQQLCKAQRTNKG